MAYESRYWKAQLKRDVTYLKKKMGLNYSDVEEDIDRHFSMLEIKIMTMAYIVRKLFDTNKLCDSLREEELDVVRYNRKKDGPVSPFKFFHEEYDLSNGNKKKIKIRKFCNHVIHSFTFQVSGDEDKAFSSIYFVSDRYKDRYIYELKLRKLVDLIKNVAENYPNKIKIFFDQDYGEYIYRMK